jgi:hypothetical protein
VNQSGFTTIGKFCQARSKPPPNCSKANWTSRCKFEAKNADFFGEYTNARMILDLGERHEKKPAAPKPNP